MTSNAEVENLFNKNGSNPETGKTYQVFVGKRQDQWIINLLADNVSAASYLEQCKKTGAQGTVWKATITLNAELEYVPPVPATVKEKGSNG